jgi:hypothetical protein
MELCFPKALEPADYVITYSCQGQQVIQVRGLHRKRPSATCRAAHFGLKIRTGGLSFAMVEIPCEDQISGPRVFRVSELHEV